MPMCLEALPPMPDVSSSRVCPSRASFLPFEGPVPLPARLPLEGCLSLTSTPHCSASVVGTAKTRLAIRAPLLLVQGLDGQKIMGSSTRSFSSWSACTLLGSNRQMLAQKNSFLQKGQCPHSCQAGLRLGLVHTCSGILTAATWKQTGRPETASASQPCLAVLPKAGWCEAVVQSQWPKASRPQTEVLSQFPFSPGAVGTPNLSIYG
uniref:Uncharacterized protein n=1 Tax=Molossus molossus TaxID=27622 RepID=A0A7J8ERB7_MOLMO|nr:hypothetical protein HJG59_008675 [Molossus molossus]